MADQEPDDLAAGNGSRGAVLGSVVFSSVPMSGVIRCGQCRWLHSSLRVTPAVAGGHGAGPRQKSGQAGSIRLAPCGLAPGGGRMPGGLAPGRWPGSAVHAARAVSVTGGPAGGLDRQRICPSRIP